MVFSLVRPSTRRRCSVLKIISLPWIGLESVGGLKGLMGRARANAQAVWDFCVTRDWIDNLAVDPATRSVTSVCLKFTDPRIKDPQHLRKPWPNVWMWKGPPLILVPIATRRQACGFGVVLRLKPQMSRPCCLGWSGPTKPSLNAQ